MPELIPVLKREEIAESTAAIARQISSDYEGRSLVMIGVLLVSSLLNIAYLVPVAARGFFREHTGTGNPRNPGIQEAPVFCVIPLSLTAVGCLLLFFFADALYALLLPITTSVTTP